MSTVFSILSILFFAAVLLGLFAPSLALFWLPYTWRTRATVLAIYAGLGLLFAFASKMSAPSQEQNSENLPGYSIDSNSTSANATAPRMPEGGVTPPASANATSGQETGVNATSKAPEAGQTGSTGAAGDKSLMDSAQETITRAANATREFGRDAAKEAGEIGSELLDGASEAGQQLLDGAKQAKDELLNSN